MLNPLPRMPQNKIFFLTLAGLGITLAGAIAVPTLGPEAIAAPPGTSAAPNRPCCPTGPMGMGHMQVRNEFDFLTLMIPHHQEAIEQAKVVVERSDRPQIREFARQIIQDQGAEVRQMRNWLDQWYPQRQSSLAHQPMMQDLSQLRGEQLNRAFLEDMLRHHREAVMMSQRLLHHNLVEHQALGPFAQNLANTQSGEMQQIRGWLQNWYGVATPGMGGMQGQPHPMSPMPMEPGRGRMHHGC